jgi:hypothetical protein
MVNNSSRQSQHNTLARISPKRIESFLLALANMGLGVVEGIRIVKRYREFFPESFPQKSGISNELRKSWKGHGEPPLSVFKFGPYVHVGEMGGLLRNVWDEPDQRRREWELFALRRYFHRVTEPMHTEENVENYPCPPLTAFEQAMFYFQRIAARAKHCPNPDCPAPYFIASKKSYKYCSPMCSGPAQQAFKRQWWAEHGAEWRQSRTQSVKKGAWKHGK